VGKREGPQSLKTTGFAEWERLEAGRVFNQRWDHLSAGMVGLNRRGETKKVSKTLEKCLDRCVKRLGGASGRQAPMQSKGADAKESLNCGVAAIIVGLAS